MLEIIKEPWAWYVSGAAIAFIMLLLLLTGKTFGMSSNLRILCSICGLGKWSDFFRDDWRNQMWNILVVIGAIGGGYFGAFYLSNDSTIALSQSTIENLESMGFHAPGASYLPEELFNFTDWTSMLILVLGGLLIGFGSRYAGGCTSGHAISGLSNFQLPSLIAVIGFFIGGLLMVHVIMPFIF
ncbi:MAG: YeeE/YedE thiosulfate transporter family protein [Xanthomarina sp.]